tara:strand:+ start:560 stop:1390 length:831 start_codon:yes stop_codon:yes gene_type:complete
MNKISVLMCIYEGDSSNHFQEALDSLLPNSKYFSELILVINGEINKYKISIINEYKKILKIKLVKLKNNVGLSRGLNIGLTKAKYQWIARFDSDDCCTKDRFKKASRIISLCGKDIDVFGTYIQEFNFDINNLSFERKVPLISRDINKRLLISNPMNHVTVIFRKALVNKFSNPSFYPHIDGFEDYALWTKLISSNVNFRNFPITTVYVRTGNSMLKRRGGFKYLIKEIKLRFYMSKYIEKKYIPLNFLIGILRILAFASPLIIKKNLYKLLRKKI